MVRIIVNRKHSVDANAAIITPFLFPGGNDGFVIGRSNVNEMKYHEE